MIAKPLLILVALVALAVPIAASLGWLGLTLQYLESPMPLHHALGDMVWQTGTDFLLVAIPMFVLLGEILLMVLLETALITPPIGINLYVVPGVRGRGEMLDVMKGAAPFVITMFVMVALMLAFPQIALWLPSLVY